MDFTDEEYLLLDTVAKDINMIQLLDKIPKEKLEKLRKYCTDHCNSYVFIRSLYRKFIDMDLILPINQYVKLYNKKYNIMVYLLGETHTNSKECPNSLETFLGELPNYPYLIDIFSEIPRYQLKKNSVLNSKNLEYMNKYHRFSKEHYNIRTHESDIRKLIKHHPLHYKIYRDLLTIPGYKIPDKFIKEGLISIPNNVKDRLYKQIHKIYDPKYKEIIKNILDNTIEHLDKLSDNIRETGKYTRAQIVSAMAFTDFINDKSLMDLYILARMHRDFEQKGKNTQNCSTRPHNVIYIAGYGHTMVMKNYLLQLDYRILVNEFSEDECNRTKDNLPMFHRPI